MAACSEGRLLNMAPTRPDARSEMAGAVPLYGTWITSVFDRLLNSSAPRCAVPPTPADAKDSWPGLARA